jgi:hypothetical protein
MNEVKAPLQVWHPELPEDRNAVLRELKDILASPHFCNSKRYPALLRYVVHRALDGDAELLKERTLGIEVFRRSATYDTNSDTIVRFTAGEVRKRLAVYYLEQERQRDHVSRIQITLPVGSYAPEFLCSVDQEEINPPTIAPSAKNQVTLPQVDAPDLPVRSAPTELPSSSVPIAITPNKLTERNRGSFLQRHWRETVLALVFLLSGMWWYRSHPRTALDTFWAPVLREQGTAMICSGGVVFAHNGFSGVTTASKDVEYPFISMQVANSINQISGLLQRGGVNYEISSAPSTPLTQLRERPLIMIGAYNNPWTLQFLAPLRFHFAPEPSQLIVDQQNPQVYWKRDRSLPYSSSDDFALVARFHDPTTDGMIVALAGLGRNGTEAAAQFATSPHYMQMLRDRVGGGDLRDKNVEVVLKIRVIEGKTGAPSIEAVHTW